VTPNVVDESIPRIFAFGSCPPTGVAGDPEEAGDVVLEKDGEGVSGVLGSAEFQPPFVGVPGVLTGVDEPLLPKLGIGEVVLEVSSKGVLALPPADRAPRLETKETE